MHPRTIFALALLTCLLGLAGCETVEKPADSTLPLSSPSGFQTGLPGVSTQRGAGFR